MVSSISLSSVELRLSVKALRQNVRTDGKNVRALAQTVRALGKSVRALAQTAGHVCGKFICIAKKPLLSRK